MEKIEKYQNLIINQLKEYAASYAHAGKGEVEEQVISDRENNLFQWLTIGWESDEVFQSYINIHFSIKPNGKIWLMENNTEILIGEELVKQGVLREDIVLGLQPPSLRPFTDFAAA